VLGIIFLLHLSLARKDERLFIDARNLGRIENPVNLVFDKEDIAKIANAYHA